MQRQRNIAMQMRRSRNGDRVDVTVKQFTDIGDRDATEGARDEFGLLAIRIGDADQFSTGQSGEHTSMIAAHHADADDAHTQRTFRACYCRLHHVLTVSPSPST